MRLTNFLDCQQTSRVHFLTHLQAVLNPGNFYLSYSQIIFVSSYIIILTSLPSVFIFPMLSCFVISSPIGVYYDCCLGRFFTVSPISWRAVFFFLAQGFFTPSSFARSPAFRPWPQRITLLSRVDSLSPSSLIYLALPDCAPNMCRLSAALSHSGLTDRQFQNCPREPQG